MNAIVWQRIEGGLVFAAILTVLILIDATSSFAPLWAMLLLFFVPDLSFAGYLAGPRAGAATYNLVHLYGFGLGLVGVGFAVGPNLDLITLGLLWTAHAGFDRMFGYGLKETTGFADTHLGRIGRDRK
ncbi:MAG: DUF4260 domain-containing protein [Pseudomonadota bacterium]